MMKTAPLSLICAAWFGFALSAPAASGGEVLAIPDFTKGDAIPAKAKAVREAIEKIQAAQDRPDLKRLK